MKLPNKIIPFKNPDKAFHERWSKGRDIGKIPQHDYPAMKVNFLHS